MRAVQIGIFFINSPHPASRFDIPLPVCLPLPRLPLLSTAYTNMAERDALDAQHAPPAGLQEASMDVEANEPQTEQNQTAAAGDAASSRPRKRSRPPTLDNEATPDHEWLQSLFGFLHYRATNGADSTPNIKSQDESERAIAAWVMQQRKNMYNYKHGSTCTMTKAKVEALLQIKDFPFQYERNAGIESIRQYSDPTRGKRHERHQEKLELLREFKERHGHCNVASRDGTLGNWVHNLRRQYNNGILDDDLIAAAEEIGLRWSHFDNMYFELKAFHEKFGHVNVVRRRNDESWPYNTLARFVETQRTNYKSGQMSKVEIEKLEVGLVFFVTPLSKLHLKLFTLLSSFFRHWALYGSPRDIERIQ